MEYEENGPKLSIFDILAKEGRWLVIFKNALASLVFEQNHSERRAGNIPSHWQRK